MGSYDFTTVRAGKNSQDAFNKAVADDNFEHGHDPYSGTIGQKGSFVLFNPLRKPMTDKQARRWLDDHFFTDDKPLRKGDRVIVFNVSVDSQGTILAKRGSKFSVEMDSGRVKLIPEFDLYHAPDPVIQRSGVDDKWGPAGCLPLTRKRFLFFGWAAS